MTIDEVERQMAVPGGRLPMLATGSSGQLLPTVVVLGEIWTVDREIRGLCRSTQPAHDPAIAKDAWDLAVEFIRARGRA
jgi:hypothetical protein